jgi:hypothetical protein
MFFVHTDVKNCNHDDIMREYLVIRSNRIQSFRRIKHNDKNNSRIFIYADKKNSGKFRGKKSHRTELAGQNARR